MTHLCHKPGGGGDQDFRSAASYLATPTGLGRAILPRGAPGIVRICLQRRATERSDEFAPAWPLVAPAQQGVRRIGVLVQLDENDPPAKSLVSAFTQALADLGWTDGRNLRIDLRQF